MRYTRYQRPGTTNHPHPLGTDVTLFLPRPQHVKKTFLITKIYPPLHLDYYFAFRVITPGYILFTW